ncbi:MAG: nucleoside triphosphate pyrophosphohydrolase [candidate division Zixibacteria bacterium]|nr:nucleoside triphosphate pyrophosphohydrolase [candidate division Zixibacteria bacterium]
MTKTEAIKKLIEIMATLRSPDGCPWDRQQTHKSLKPYLIEEAFEVLDAIDSDNPQKLKEELGDLLLHIVFHAQMAEEARKFNISDIANAISDKLIKRHPHVFGDKKNVTTSEDVLSNWEHIKAETSEEKKYYVLNGLPNSMPALLKAYRIQEKVARFGFDWSNPIEILDKLDEERSELREAIQNGNITDIENELGDLLFTVVNISRHFNIYPAGALNSTSEKFRERFRLMEDYIMEDGKKLGSLRLDELDVYWDKAKKTIK